MEAQQKAGIKVFTLAFVVNKGACQPAWGELGLLANDNLPNGTTVQKLVDRIRASGGDVIISFGGQSGPELALHCSSEVSLQGAYQAVIDRYHATMLDFDVEQAALNDTASLTRRNQAIKALQEKNPGLIVSYTLPVMPTGLIDSGVQVLKDIKNSGASVDVVNIMTMDYGDNSARGANGMSVNAIRAAEASIAQIKQIGLTARLGVIPMIGQNDVRAEVFTLADARKLLQFAQDNRPIARIAIWSGARDNGNCAGNKKASSTCSGVAQHSYEFSRTLNQFH